MCDNVCLLDSLKTIELSSVELSRVELNVEPWKIKIFVTFVDFQFKNMNFRIFATLIDLMQNISRHIC